MVNPNSDMRVRFKGKDFFFCGDICMRTFKDDPFPYIDFNMNVNISIEPVQKTPGMPDEAGTTGSDTPPGTSDTTVKTLEPLTNPADTGTAPVEHGARPSDTTPKTLDTPPAAKKPPVKTGPVIEEIPLNGESKPPETRTNPPKTGGENMITPSLYQGRPGRPPFQITPGWEPLRAEILIPQPGFSFRFQGISKRLYGAELRVSPPEPANVTAVTGWA